MEPSQSLEFLGFLVNLLHQELSLTAGKVKKIRPGPKHSICWKATRLQPDSRSNFWEHWSGNQSSASGTSVPPQVATSIAENVRAVRSGLLCPTYPLHKSKKIRMPLSLLCMETRDHLFMTICKMLPNLELRDLTLSTLKVSLVTIILPFQADRWSIHHWSSTAWKFYQPSMQ